MEANFKFNLNIKRYKDDLQKELAKKMELCCAMVSGYIKQTLSISNFGGTQPSKPGDPPHAGTGMLRNSITFLVDKRPDEVVGTVGVARGLGANKYALRLELGFVGIDSLGRNVNQLPRPFLKPSLVKKKREIRVILAGK